MFAVAEFDKILLLYIVAVVFVPSIRHWVDNWLTVLGSSRILSGYPLEFSHLKQFLIRKLKLLRATVCKIFAYPQLTRTTCLSCIIHSWLCANSHSVFFILSCLSSCSNCVCLATWRSWEQNLEAASAASLSQNIKHILKKHMSRAQLWARPSTIAGKPRMRDWS